MDYDKSEESEDTVPLSLYLHYTYLAVEQQAQILSSINNLYLAIDSAKS